MALRTKWRLLVLLVALALSPTAPSRSAASSCAGGQAIDSVDALVHATQNASACNVAAVWKYGPVTFTVLNQQPAAEFLGRSDAFTQAMTSFDFEARMQRAQTHSESSYLQFAASNALDWQPDELEHLENSVRRLMTQTTDLELPFPPEILIIKTNGREEFGAAYTRGNAMVLPTKVVKSAADTSTFVYHETYHILTRHSPAFRAEMNARLGFTAVPRAAEDPLPARSVTNPDLGFLRWAMSAEHRGAPVRVTPVLYSRVAALDVRSVGSFRYALAVLGPDGRIATDGGGRFVEVHPDTVGFHDRIGMPRNYPLHPEELMALFFESIVKARNDGGPATRFADPFTATPPTRRPDQDLFPTRGPLNWEEATAVVDRLAEIYEPAAQQRGKTLEMELEWTGEGGQASAYNYSHSDRMSVSVGGGLARHTMMTPDTLAKIVCHELGHLFGGAPMRKSPMKEPNSVELQADYWSTAKCLRQYFAVDGSANLTWVTQNPIDPLAEDKCNRQFRDPVDAAVCMRSVMASLNEVRMLETFASRSQNPPAQLSTPSRTRVSIIERYSTDNQCRLDTLFQGALCRESYTTPASDTDAKQGFCNRSLGNRTGARPRCWYRAGAPVHQMGHTSY